MSIVVGDWSRLACRLVAACAVLTGCATTRLDKFEEKLDTDSALKFEFHRIIDDPNGLGLRFPGLVFGFEKAARELIDCPDVDDCPDSDNSRFERHISLARAEGGKPSTIRSQLEGRLDDGKQIFLSHVVEYAHDPSLNGIDAVFQYRSVYPNPFEDPEGPAEPNNGLDRVNLAYENSWTTIEAPGRPAGTANKTVRSRLESNLEAGQYTHIVLYTMGWNSGQTEALRNVNSLHLALLRGARRAGLTAAAFKPYPVLVTWPSHWPWYAGPLSYMNKANDADELGAVFLNAIVHRMLLPVAKQMNLRTVAVGHSFGVRALTRALASRSLLAGTIDPTRWQLLIGLQGAFSINRFAMLRGSWEGAPYRWIDKYVSKVVLSWSEHDSANRVAFWSNHAGGSSGGARAREINDEYVALKKPPLFDLQKLTKAEDVAKYSQHDPRRILYMDASKLVRFDNYVKSGGAHSDVYTEEMGRVLSALIQRYAP